MSALISYGSRDLLMTSLAGIIAGQLKEVIARKGKARLALPGGSTPGPLFDVLAQGDLSWDKVTVMLTDERWVPEDNPRSNAALVRKRLLQGPASAANFISFAAIEDRPEAGMDRLIAEITPHLPLDICLLGMGADMHTASLFPGADLLALALSEAAPVLLALRAKAAGEARLSLSAPVLKATTHVHLLITGPEKRAALEAAYRQVDVAKAPVRVILDQAQVHYAK